MHFVVNLKINGFQYFVWTYIINDAQILTGHLEIDSMLFKYMNWFIQTLVIRQFTWSVSVEVR